MTRHVVIGKGFAAEWMVESKERLIRSWIVKCLVSECGEMSRVRFDKSTRFHPTTGHTPQPASNTGFARSSQRY